MPTSQEIEKLKEIALKNQNKPFTQWDNISSEPSQPDPPTPSVGEEFVKWAEMYWNLESKYTDTNTEGEASIYKHTREIFVKKINGILEERLL